MIDSRFLLAVGVMGDRLIFPVPYRGTQERLKFILECSFGRCQFCPFSPYRAGRDFFCLILWLAFVLGFCGRWAGRPHFYTFSPYRRNGGRPKYGIIV